MLYIYFDSLKLWLEEISKSSSFTKIILLRYYKVPYNITFILTEKLGLNLSEIKDKILEPYLIFNGMMNIKNLEPNDIRSILYKKYVKDNDLKDEEIDDKIKNPLDTENYPSLLHNYLEQLDSLLNNYLDFLDLENCPKDTLAQFPKQLLI